jgi:hypothetical protein
MYSTDPEWIAECRSNGLHVTVAIAANLPDTPGTRDFEKGRVVDADGKPVAAPWMRNWGVAWGCINSPEYRDSLLAHLKPALAGGVDGIHVDDLLFNLAAVQWGGCHCGACREKASKEGVDLQVDMEAFQRESVDAFYRWLRPTVNRLAGRDMPMSGNNGGVKWGFPMEHFDFGIGEVKDASPQNLHPLAQAAAAQGKAQMIVLMSSSVHENRQAVATCYALGMPLVAPWDVFLGSNRDRYFGDLYAFSDLYSAVRSHGFLFEGFEEAAVLWPNGPMESQYPQGQPLAVSPDEDLLVVVRVKQDESKKSIMSHLVDLSGNPGPKTS